MAIFLFASVAPSWAAAVKRPAITAGGAVTYCQNTGEIIFAKNKNKRFAPYSTTKMMTALLAVQNLPMGDFFAVLKIFSSIFKNLHKMPYLLRL
jgi:D-alanyl-D-alanine carboxypeptidase